MSVPFHKQTDPAKQAGQLVNQTPEHLTLAGYIKTVKRAQAFDDVANEKKLTFDEWGSSVEDSEFDGTVTRLSGLVIWNTALIKGKL